MTTIAYCHSTKTLGADTRLTYMESYPVYCNKILFPKAGMVLATAGDAGEGEWLKHKLSKMEDLYSLYFLDDKPKFSKSFSAFIWWDKKAYCIYSDLFPIPIESAFWVAGSGGPFALAYLAIGQPMDRAIFGATKLDINSGGPVHVVDLNAAKQAFRISIHAK